MYKYRVIAHKVLQDKKLNTFIQAADLGFEGIVADCGLVQIMTFEARRKLGKIRIKKIVDIIKQADENCIYRDIKVELIENG